MLLLHHRCAEPDEGFEPPTSALQVRCGSNAAYPAYASTRNCTATTRIFTPVDSCYPTDAHNNVERRGLKRLLRIIYPGEYPVLYLNVDEEQLVAVLTVVVHGIYAVGYLSDDFIGIGEPSA